MDIVLTIIDEVDSIATATIRRAGVRGEWTGRCACRESAWEVGPAIICTMRWMPLALHSLTRRRAWGCKVTGGSEGESA